MDLAKAYDIEVGFSKEKFVKIWIMFGVNELGAWVPINCTF